jgi:hypothetical protein
VIYKLLYIKTRYKIDLVFYVKSILGAFISRVEVLIYSAIPGYFSSVSGLSTSDLGLE